MNERHAQTMRHLANLAAARRTATLRRAAILISFVIAAAAIAGAVT